MLSFVERFICATFFPLCSVQNFNITTIQSFENCVCKKPRWRFSIYLFCITLPSHTPTSNLYHALEVTLDSFLWYLIQFNYTALTLSALFKSNWTQRHRFGDWYSYTHSPSMDCASRHSLYRLVRRNFRRRRNVVSSFDDQWRAHLIDLPNPKMFNNGHTFMLIVVEKFSNFA